MSVQIVRVEGALPEGFPALRAQAEAEGVRNMSALAAQWVETENPFRDPGALFAAFAEGELVGLGGVTPQPGLDRPAMRMRRLYVAPSARRLGVGRMLAAAMMQQGLQAADLLVSNAQATAAAPPFWEAMGFAQAPEGMGFSHWMGDGIAKLS
ncbi:GNAT superfamily N-acetyltransferase [Caulobacter ginsengisoli]|uniref:GNAT superfamily N-acetyltransferase n=1 Tax=Caulobacter ginsengisoli TaxID=400775 RepID=A0ABU0INQ1_9CAUL|nr:GNAT family N-acetyltransferase [Caulobacter ginsengisoli]MDQ0463610.1 GNAT superfamily N-acetyltransferase [Caulobacter ginsengisoli]